MRWRSYPGVWIKEAVLFYKDSMAEIHHCRKFIAIVIFQGEFFPCYHQVVCLCDGFLFNKHTVLCALVAEDFWQVSVIGFSCSCRVKEFFHFSHIRKSCHYLTFTLSEIFKGKNILWTTSVFLLIWWRVFKHQIYLFQEKFCSVYLKFCAEKLFPQRNFLDFGCH